jgi:hypothetical protein
MNPPRNHHYIPVFYLKRWAAGEDQKLFEYSRPYRKVVCKRVGPRATGWEKDLYSYPELPLEERHIIESQFFSRTDQLASDALDRLYTPHPEWTAHLVTAWSRFVQNFRIRHPDSIKELRAHIAKTWDKTDDYYEREYAKTRGADSPPTLSEYMKVVDLQTAIKLQMKLLHAAIDNGRLGQRINDMHWRVIILGSSAYPLLTSDWAAELAFAQDVLSLPIGPKRLFVASNSEQTLRSVAGADPRRLSASVNRFVVTRARRYVYASDETQTRFIEKHFGAAREAEPLWPSLGQSHADHLSSVSPRTSGRDH